MKSPIGLKACLVVLALWFILARQACQADDAVAIQRLPLGLKLDGQTGDRTFGVYIPTRYGGELTVTAKDAKVGSIIGPDGRERTNGADVGPNAHGWYTFTVKGSQDEFSVSTTFIQVGRSKRQPWNFYYWPTKADSIHEPWSEGNGQVDTIQTYGDDVLVAPRGARIAPGQDIVLAGSNGLLETPVAPGDDSTWFPNLYDDLTFRGANGAEYQVPSPLLKYDQIFRTSSRRWEAANSQNKEITRWPGHCLGGAVASILLNEPSPVPGSGLTRDELKALWAELAENHRNHRIGDYVVDIPPGPPRPGPDPCDRFASSVHKMLEVHIRGRQVPLLSNLRAFPPRGTIDEVWNHAIGIYTAKYTAVPGADVHTTAIEVELVANSGSSLDGQEESPRVVRYAYILTYGPDGIVDLNQAYLNDWTAIDGQGQFAPLNVIELVESRWAGHNPHVTEANVRMLDQANGGSAARFSGVDPQFQPVGVIEAGGASRIADVRGARLPGLPRRGVLSRLFGGR
jgi:hypothetical protein